MKYLLLALAVVLAPTARVTKSIAFVVDVSGSMEADDINAAILAFLEIAEQPTDEMEIRLYTFDDALFPYGKGWYDLPDPATTRAMKREIQIRQGPRGTLLVPAIRYALADPKQNITVVIISDGHFSEDPPAIHRAIAESQSVRKTRAVIATVIVGTAPGEVVMKKIGEDGRGGCYR